MGRMARKGGMINVTIFVVINYECDNIEAVFDSEELAKEYVNHFYTKEKNNVNIESYKLNPLMKEIREGYHSYSVDMKRNGDTTSILEVSGISIYEPIIRGDKQSMFCRIMARTKEHAIKIANEKRSKLIATNKWIV